MRYLNTTVPEPLVSDKRVKQKLIVQASGQGFDRSSM